jgi:hypothetical protein
MAEIHDVNYCNQCALNHYILVKRTKTHVRKEYNNKNNTTRNQILRLHCIFNKMSSSLDQVLENRQCHQLLHNNTVYSSACSLVIKQTSVERYNKCEQTTSNITYKFIGEKKLFLC